jgi:selenide,water dikinase
VLDEILKGNISVPDNKNLLVGNNSKDDAAVYDLENGMALISTTDFFMPIVDDAFDFGRIAAANSISDVYAMGGKPLLAIAVLGWPVEKLPVELAQKIIDGGRTICNEAGFHWPADIALIHQNPFLVWQLQVLSIKKDLKKNNTAEEGDLIFLTKPLGVGILSTHKKESCCRKNFFK